MSRKLRIVATVIAASLALILVAGLAIDGVHWRIVALQQKATGRLESVPWNELVAMIMPGSGFYLRGLIETPNPYAVIRNPHNSARDIATGKSLFESNCMSCHGASALGGSAPALIQDSLSQGDSDWAIFRTLSDGVPGTAMGPSQLTSTERWQLTGYLLRLRQAGNTGDQVDAGPSPNVSVPYERIVNAVDEPENWLTYSGKYNGQRHSRLSGIRRSTIDRLGLKWVLQTDAREEIEASPIVVDGVMYMTLPEGIVLALDAKTGDTIWRWTPEIEKSLSVCCGRVNRGVAVLEDRVYAATLDNRLQALSASDGDLLWETIVADSSDGYTITAAPLAVKNLILIGVSGGEFGIRGYLDAYDSVSGERVWRFYTIPEPGQPGHETWSGDSWRTGGGPTWVTGSFDRSLNLVYWGVGNPSPDFDGSLREGDNLYTNSVVALDVDSGELRWFFQFTPHDLHDYDANQIPVLVDRVFRGEERQLMLWANRNGFFYALDRQSGKYLGSMPYAKQTWAVEIDESGKPVRDPSSMPSPRGTLVWPGASGATNWPPPTYSQSTGLFYVARLNRPSVYFNHETPEEREPDRLWLGSALTFVPDSSETSVIAIDPERLAIVWETQLEDVGGRGRFTGLLSTPELVFVGDGEVISAIDNESGEVLWTSRLGGPVGSPPTTYEVDGVQYLTIAAGKNVYAFGVNLP